MACSECPVGDMIPIVDQYTLPYRDKSYVFEFNSFQCDTCGYKYELPKKWHIAWFQDAACNLFKRGIDGNVVKAVVGNQKLSERDMEFVREIVLHGKVLSKKR